MNGQLAHEYNKWLQTQQFSYFFTGTFRGEGYTVNGARKALQRFFKRSIHRPEFAFLCIESGELYGRIHTHGLLRYPEKAIFHPGEPISADWKRLYGYSRMEVPRSQADVTAYCIKYATKQLKEDTYLIL